MWISPTAALRMTEDRTPPGVESFRTGVARASLGAAASSLAQAKLQPRCPTDGDRINPHLWPITAADWKVVLAPRVPDAFQPPELLFPAFDRHHLPEEDVVGLVTTVYYPKAITRHDCMAEVIAYADRLACRWALSSLVVLHVPGDSRHEMAMHGHILSLPLKHLPTGFAAPTPLLNKKGPGLLHKELLDLRAARCR
ncbi:MAG TPA: hypothetical protein VKQ27_19015 [Acetobacteraceae bacterium]|nr:hypothetical protein [Acetobacteraceae bacterium]